MSYKELNMAMQIKAEICRESDGSYTIILHSLDLAGNGFTPEEAINNVIQDLKVYAEEYFSRLELYSNAPNRRGHLPYVSKITHAKNDEEIRDMLDLTLHTPKGMGFLGD